MAKRKSRSSGRSSGGLSPENTLMGGLIYGAARNKISSTLRGMVGGGLGSVSDEVIMGVISYLAAKKGSGILRDAGKAGLAIEASRFSQNFSLSGVSTVTTSTSTTSGATF